jgi:hypothetical protein
MPWYIVAFFIFGVLVALLADVRDYSGMFLFARGVLVGLLVLSLLLPARWAIPIFFVVTVVGVDRLQAAGEIFTHGEFTTASIWRIWLGPIRPSWIVTICAFVQIVKVLPLVIDKPVKIAAIWFATVPLVTGYAYGGFHTGVAFIHIPSDIRLGVMLILGVVLYRSLLRKYPDYLTILLALLAGVLLARHFVNVVYFLIGHGGRGLTGAIRVSVDAAKSTVIFALLFGLYLTLKKKRFVLGPVISLGSSILVVVFATRMIWLLAIVGCAILLYIYGAKRALIMLPVVLVMAWGGIRVIRALKPLTAEVIAIRVETFTPGRSGNILMRVDPIRYMQVANSTNTNLKRFAVFWGSGYGGYYTDEVITFPRELTDAFPEYSAITGKFYFCHNYVLEVLFKHGIIGLIIITSLWLVPGWRCYRLFDKRDSSMLSGFTACLLAFLPTAIFHLWWSGKGLLINGFIIAALMSIAERLEERQMYELEEVEYEQSGCAL